MRLLVAALKMAPGSEQELPQVTSAVVNHLPAPAILHPNPFYSSPNIFSSLSTLGRGWFGFVAVEILTKSRPQGHHPSTAH